MKPGNLTTLHRYSADAANSIERRFQLVGGKLPKLCGGELIGAETISKDREGRKCQPVRSDLCGCWKRLSNFAECCVHKLEGLKHVLVPVEEKADLRRTTAGSGTHCEEPGN